MNTIPSTSASTQNDQQSATLMTQNNNNTNDVSSSSTLPKLQPRITPEDIMQTLKDPEVRKKLFLGSFYEKLNLSKEKEKQLFEDILKAKKYEKKSREKVQQQIEDGEIQNLLHSQAKSEELAEIYKKELSDLANKMNDGVLQDIRRSQEYENALFLELQKRLVGKGIKKLSKLKEEYLQEEKKIKEQEEQEIKEREIWRAKLQELK